MGGARGPRLGASGAARASMSQTVRGRAAAASVRPRHGVISLVAIACLAAGACTPAHVGPAARVGPRGHSDLPAGGRTRAVVAGLETDEPRTADSFSRAVADYETGIN